MEKEEKDGQAIPFEIEGLEPEEKKGDADVAEQDSGQVLADGKDKQQASILEPVALPDDDDTFNFSIAAVLGGEMLGGAWMRRQVKFISLLLLLTVLYITNRYSAEQELIEIADCKKELQDIKYRSLTRSSELTMRTRQSMIEEALRHAGDSTLQMSKVPPFILIENDETEE